MTIDQPLFKELENDIRYVAELKFKGDHLILKRLESFDERVLSNDTKRWDASPAFEFWNRHGSKFKYDPSATLLSHLNSLNWKGECVCDGELLHNKVHDTKHMIVLWDIFLFDGVDLKKRPYIERHLYLERIFKDIPKYQDIFISEQWKNGWQEVYDREIVREEIEGLVLKRLDAKLELGRTSSPVIKYMYKVRKPSGSYKF
jgi:hypothetical protein